jgi:hypothetical protein
MLWRQGLRRRAHSLDSRPLGPMERPDPKDTFEVVRRKPISPATFSRDQRLMADGREVWSKSAVAVPWAPNEDRSVTLTRPCTPRSNR